MVVAAGANLPLTSTEAATTPSAFTVVTPGSTSVQVNTAGVYYISYSVPVSTAGQAAIVIDPAGPTAPIVGVSGRSRAAAGNMLTGWTIATLTATSTVGIRNFGTASFTTSTVAQGAFSGELYLQKVG